ncbi:MAG: ribulose-phosphate 3-epimerase [Pirellulaceae bacterium]|nr:ribulose-phosphate 3-epimerase [Pirellulaceae bacterium]
MTQPLQLKLGVKTDPIEYRYSHPWLFSLLQDIGIDYVQIGTHFELYQLPDEFFHQLREQAESSGIQIHSTFTAHRELGGFFREEPGYESIARKNFERYIEIGGILGVQSVGSNPGAVMRDRMQFKDAGIACYIKHMKELLHLAKEKGVSWLTIEPMSCLAEPPTLPEECVDMAADLTAYHLAHPDATAKVGYCSDIAHGYVDHSGQVIHDHFELFDATLPWLYEVHLKNTDPQYSSTFGFNPDERTNGIIDVAAFRDRLRSQADQLPVQEMVGYLEIGGPKLGRDYSDHHLENLLRESFEYLKQAWLEDPTTSKDNDSKQRLTLESQPLQKKPGIEPEAADSETGQARSHVCISPSMMCADQLHFEDELKAVKSLSCDMLHMDIMDGKFVPNMAMGLGVLQQTAEWGEMPVDVHLMVTDNDFFVDEMKDWNIHQISVHFESALHLDRTLSRIRDCGSLAGLALNPSTPLNVMDYVLERIDYVLIMTVNPGYAGQKLTPGSIRKIRDCRKKLDSLGLTRVPIQVDGNVSFDNIPKMVAAGATNLVAGTSSIFHRDGSRTDNMSRIHHCIEAAKEVRFDTGDRNPKPAI